MPRLRAHRRKPPRRAPKAGARVAAALAAAAAAWAPAQAGDRSVTGSLAQTFVADTNTQLQQGAGFQGGSLTRIGLQYLDRTPTAALRLSTGFSYSYFTGRENRNIDGLFPRLSGSYSVSRPTQNLSIGFNASLRPVRFLTDVGLPLDPIDPVDPTPPDPEDPSLPDPDDDFDDDIVLPPDIDDPIDPDEPPDEQLVRTARETLRLNFGANVGYSRRINPRESISFGAGASRTQYLDNDGSLVPNTSANLRGGWNRQLTERASAGLSANARWFRADGGANRETVSLSLGPTATYRRTARERYAFSLGPSWSMTSVDTATGRRTESSLSLRGAAGLTYATPGRSYSLRLSQSLVPADAGATLVNSTRLTFGTSQRVTETAGISGSLGVGYQTRLSGDETSGFRDRISMSASLGFNQRVDPRNSYSLGGSIGYDDQNGLDRYNLGFNAGWSHQLSQNVSARLGYTFRFRTTEGGSDFTSHRATLTLSRPFVLLR